MAKILISIERPKGKSTGVVKWSEDKTEASARFDVGWKDEQVMKHFGLAKPAENGKGKSNV